MKIIRYFLMRKTILTWISPFLYISFIYSYISKVLFQFNVCYKGIENVDISKNMEFDDILVPREITLKVFGYLLILWLNFMTLVTTIHNVGAFRSVWSCNGRKTIILKYKKNLFYEFLDNLENFIIVFTIKVWNSLQA